MELRMSLNTLLRPPLSTPSSTFRSSSSSFNQSLFSIPKQFPTKTHHNHNHNHVLVVKAMAKRSRVSVPYKRQPSLPKLEDDGNPKFVILIRADLDDIWYPVSIVSGGTTAKIMLAAKDNFLGKYIYKDTLDRNLATVIYRDEKEIQKAALEQHPILKSATNFIYGYTLIVDGKVRAALSSGNVTQLPTPDKLKTVADKVKDFFEDVKDTFAQITSLDDFKTKKPKKYTKAKSKSEEPKKDTKAKSKSKVKRR